tara:strand:- start:371 stop:610 length:240 start_codon:yes stop_codon:yes gene_type:complete
MNWIPPIVLVDEWGSAYMIDRESDEMVQIPISNEGIMLFDEMGVVQIDMIPVQERKRLGQILFSLRYAQKLKNDKIKNS